jgi:hypothetical protein
MTAQRDAEALVILRKRGIDVIVIYPKSCQAEVYGGAEDVVTFYERLVNGQLPAWLEPVPLPEELAERFVFFKLKCDSTL